MTILRRVLILAVLSGLYLLVFEAVVRWRWPQDKETVFLAGGSLGMKDTSLGHKLRPESWSRTRTPEFDVEYRVNAEGWRDAALYPPPDQERTKQRILLLGDSFTFGEGVAYEAIWPVLLEERLGQRGVAVEVIKAGVPGYDTRREVLLLEKVFERYRPDAVLLVFVPNDLFTNLADEPPPETTEASTSEPATAADTDVITAHEEKKRRPSLHSLSLLQRLVLQVDRLYVHLYLETGRARYFASHPDPVLTRQLEITEAWLERARRFCAERGIAFGVLSIPQQFQVLAAAHQLETNDIDVTVLDKRFRAFAAEQGFAWTALLPELMRHYVETDEELYFRRDGHLNARGHRVVADWLVERWDELGLEIPASVVLLREPGSWQEPDFGTSRCWERRHLAGMPWPAEAGETPAFPATAHAGGRPLQTHLASSTRALGSTEGAVPWRLAIRVSYPPSPAMERGLGGEDYPPSPAMERGLGGEDLGSSVKTSGEESR